MSELRECCKCESDNIGVFERAGEWYKECLDCGESKEIAKWAYDSILKCWEGIREYKNDIYCRFGAILADANKEYSRHYITKGDSWLNMDIRNLREIILNIHDKWRFEVANGDRQGEYDELVDLLLVIMMLVIRLDERGTAG